MKAEEKIDKDKLYEFYIIQNHNGKETAEYFSTSVSTINRAVRLHGFKKEPEMSWKNQSIGRKSKNQISKEDLYDYYIIQNHSHKECEEFFNTTYAIIHLRLKEYGIKKDPKKTYELSNGFSVVKDYQPSCVWCDNLSHIEEYIDDESIIEENKNKKYWRIYDCGRKLLRYKNNIKKGGSK